MAGSVCAAYLVNKKKRGARIWRAGIGVLWVMLSWETFDPVYYLDVTDLGDKVHPLIERYSLMAMTTFDRIMAPARLQQIVKKGLRNKNTSSRC